MAKDKIAFVCSNCGQESAKWMGKCPSCGQWNTFKEIRIAADSGSQAAKNAGMTMRHGGAATMFWRAAQRARRCADETSRYFCD